MRAALVLPALLILAACATPLEQCLNDATRESRALNAEIGERRLNLARGFAMEQVVVPDFGPRLCPPPPGSPPGTGYVTCFEWEDRVIERRRPIDPVVERERIAALEAILAREERRATQAAAQCRAQFPG